MFIQNGILDFYLSFTIRKFNVIYLIPLNFRAPLIFAHLACAKIRGGNFAQDRCAKFIGSRYYVSKYRQKSKLLSKKGCAKIKGTEKSAGARKLKARKLEARK